MTGNTVLDLIISVAGVTLLVLLARMLFGGGALVFNKAAVEDRLCFDEPDFSPADWIIDEAARAALARNENNEVALIVANGDGLAIRRFQSPDALSARYANGVLSLTPHDHTSRKVTLSAPDIEAQPLEGRQWLDCLGISEDNQQN